MNPFFRLNVLLACECSQILTEQFTILGHKAMSCDLNYDGEKGLPHHRGDVREILHRDWDLMVAHPPCTFVACSANRWLYHPEDRHLPIYQRRPHPQYPTRLQDANDAIEFFKFLAHQNHIPFRALENPRGRISNAYRKPDQIVQPWHFGDSAQKETHLWLYNLPPLKKTNVVDPGEFYTTTTGKRMPAWYNEAKKGGIEQTQKNRSYIFPGMAKAMAEQWSAFAIKRLTKAA